jgi:hypothetical protein
MPEERLREVTRQFLSESMTHRDPSTGEYYGIYRKACDELRAEWTRRGQQLLLFD